MKRLIKNGLIFIVNYLFICFSSNAQNNISSYQYWIDNDYGSKTYVSVTPTENLELNTTVSLETITDGLHSFNIRFRDDKNRWSITSSDFFYYNELTANNINSYQYWFDNDYSTQTTATVTTAEELLLDTAIPIETISDGLHLFSIRFKDDKGTWSIPQNQYFYYNNLTDSNVVAYQYWFDNDIDTNELVAIIPTQQMELIESVPIDNIEEGLHVFSIRFKDNKGHWSIPVNQYFYKANHVTDNKITAYRYWINDDIDNAIHVSINSPKQFLNLSEDIDFLGLAIGDYTIHFQFKDTSDNWSVVTSDEFSLTSLSVIENEFKKLITAYPNPTKSDVNFDMGESYRLIEVKIFDNTGRFIQQETFSNLQKFRLNINNDSDGIYYIMLIADDKKATLKFIKY
jgi:hypothetical protein